MVIQRRSDRRTPKIRLGSARATATRCRWHRNCRWPQCAVWKVPSQCGICSYRSCNQTIETFVVKKPSEDKSEINGVNGPVVCLCCPSPRTRLGGGILSCSLSTRSFKRKNRIRFMTLEIGWNVPKRFISTFLPIIFRKGRKTTTFRTLESPNTNRITIDNFHKAKNVW